VIDEIVFEEDIAHQLQKEKTHLVQQAKQEAAAEFDRNFDIQGKKAAMNQAQEAYQTASAQYIAEMEGKGTGMIGYGAVAKQKQIHAQERKQALSGAETQYTEMLRQKDA